MIETATRTRLRNPAIVVVSPKQELLRKTRRARRTVFSFVLLFLGLNLALSQAIQGPAMALRDPEFAAHRDRLLARQREYPDRPLILVLGSSRAVEGIRPDAVNGESGPLLINGGLVGSGPILELLSFRRLIAAGLKPTAVLIEYWPPLMRGDQHAEFGRIDLPRLGPADLPIVRDYFPDPPSATRYVLEGQIWPAWRYRKAIQTSVRPKWVPDGKRDARFAAGMDNWGWWPGCRDDDAEQERLARSDASRNPFRVYLDGFTVGKEADRALHELIRECQRGGIEIALVALPEGKPFRALYGESTSRMTDDYLKQLTEEYHIRAFDDRANDTFAEHLPDLIHLTQGGAARWTRRLAEHLPDLFPTLDRKSTKPVVP